MPDILLLISLHFEMELESNLRVSKLTQGLVLVDVKQSNLLLIFDSLSVVFCLKMLSPHLFPYSVYSSSLILYIECVIEYRLCYVVS